MFPQKNTTIRIMKTSIRISLTALLALLHVSCAKQADALENAASMPEIYNGFGEISRVTDDHFEIIRDDNALLRVVEYSGSQEITVGKRVYFKYNIISENDTRSTLSSAAPPAPQYDIRIIVFNPIHTAPIIRKSFLLGDDPFRSDSLGDDPIRILTAAFSGKYINIGFEYFRYSEGAEHIVNLVWDDTQSGSDSVYLELRHNAMGEIMSGQSSFVSDTGLASFRISDLVPAGADSINIKLKSNLDRKDGVGEYIETDKYYSGTYFPQ